MRPKRRFRLALAVIAIVCGVVASPLAVEALVPKAGVTLGFGGLIVWMHPCTMTTMGLPAWYMIVLDKSAPYIPFPMILLPPPVSRLNMYFAPIIGNAVLGGMMPIPGLCTVSLFDYWPYVGFVSPYPFEGMGTSLVPFANVAAG